MTTLKNLNFKAYARPVGLLAAVIIVVAVVFVVRATHKTSPYVTRSACQILTPAIAQSVFPSAQPVVVAPKVTADTKTTYCLYRDGDTVIALAERTPLTKNGIKLNQKAFSSPVLATAKVLGYGDAANWAPGLGQLNILNHNNWYILTSGSISPGQRSLDATKKVADKISAQL